MSKPSASPLREMLQPLVDLVRAPRALWAVNIAYFLDGLVYFGMLSVLGKFFVEYVGLSDQWTSPMVGFLTWGVTFSMFLLGGKADVWSPRFSMVSSLLTMGAGRVVLVLGVTLGMAKGGLWSPIHWVALFGLLLIVIGNGVFQPAAYASVKRFTDDRTAPMGYAMLYAVMNLGGFVPTFISPPLRRAHGVYGVFLVYAAMSLVSAALTAVLLTRRATERAREILAARVAAQAAEEKGDASGDGAEGRAEDEPRREQRSKSVGEWLRSHPLADVRFSFFIFILIPVMTLFAHSWLTTPAYVERVFAGGWVGKNFEAATNLNPLLIFVLVPLTTALTQKVPVMRMMVVGTTVMALSPLLLVIAPHEATLFSYLVVKSTGEALWQPRFLQYAAELAPPGRTGAYMGVAQFPWFLTKMLTSLYAGVLVARFIPKGGPYQSQTMWALHTAVAVVTPLALLLTHKWLARGIEPGAGASKSAGKE